LVRNSRPQVDIGAAHILEEPLVKSKRRDAVETVRSCIGPEGVSASGGLSTYSYEYWTRDMCYSYEALASLGLEIYVKQHVNQVIALAREGQVPTLFYRYPKVLSPAARFTDQVDNELLILDLMKRIGMPNDYDGVWKYVESMIGRDGFVYGRDWRDGMKIYRNKATFHNQVLLYKVRPEEMREELKGRIDEVFWLPDEGHYADWVDRQGNRSSHLDVLGHALAILHNLIPKSRIELVKDNLEHAFTEYGYVNILPRYPRRECGWWRLIPNNLYQNGGVWGLVHGHMILALLHLNLLDEATDQFWTMTRWKGFNEWYDPQTGKPKGSRSQLWTAALWLKCNAAISERVRQDLEAEDSVAE